MSTVRRFIDLRSDTVTRPSPGMRRAIAEAEVGDDVFGDDPTVIALEKRVATLLGMEEALLVPSGTMGNLVALCAVTEPGDEVILDRQCHIFNYEVASAAAVAGLQMQALDGDGGLLSAEQVEAHLRPGSLHSPCTRVVAMENTHNRAGGRVYSLERMQKVSAVARARRVHVHLDGARLGNAHAATGASFQDYGACCDSVSMCFSKGLGAPVGSAVASTAEVVARARRFRKRLGGGMRQAGVLAAAALYALDHNIERLKDDHANARRLGEFVARTAGLEMIHEIETNIVVARVDEGAFSVDAFLGHLRDNGVLAVPFGPGLVRMVTHLDVSSEDIGRTGEVLASMRRR